MTTVNGTKLWLEEGVVHAGKMLKDLIKVEEYRKLSPAEKKMKTVSATKFLRKLMMVFLTA